MDEPKFPGFPPFPGIIPTIDDDDCDDDDDDCDDDDADDDEEDWGDITPGTRSNSLFTGPTADSDRVIGNSKITNKKDKSAMVLGKSRGPFIRRLCPILEDSPFKPSAVASRLPEIGKKIIFIRLFKYE